MIKGFVFDLDGVIAETAKLHYKAWKNEVKKIGIDFTEEENATLKGLPRVETLRGILKIHNMTSKVSEETIQEMALVKNEEYLKLLKTDLSKDDILPGIENLLKDAKANNVKLVIASSSLNAPRILKQLGLLDYFEDIVNPTEIINGKPAPDIYLKACELINIKPHEAIGFEDAMPGVVGLKAANIKTVAITWGDEGEWEKADLILNSTAELNFEKVINI
ncbi:beta-phosphoglucomutase [Mycoplasma todarodis]|uniref:Beta-phosphoglucomutase n=1 Tax=Mycoplasma todarodis TaxID=1937191 RepID=A0A4R0XLU1_9MOLU|nr:beta-phosphoglucomutase [Mycoplasma todarodis]TCG11653.1 beta-phosphoglucomutase [Mycoplasma todarodis]